MDDLELYPRVNPVRAAREGVRSLRANWKRLLSYGLALLLVFGVAGYRWITTATPMDRTDAIQLFRAERGDVVSGDADADAERPRSGSRNQQQGEGRGSGSKQRARVASTTRVVAGGGPQQSQSTQSNTSTSEGNEFSYTAPEEGVYSWATEGYEQVSGARRQFPKETQRIMTLSDNRSWTQHHYFSEEREIWTQFHWGTGGAEITQQRNKVTFGPVTNESMIDFNPPMLVGPRDLEVGYEWGGKWTGDTHGDYISKVFEHTTLDIGGEKVEVWGMSYVINLRGEQQGKVTAEVWLAPAEGLTVKEHYVQDVESSGARYHAEWKQTLKSMTPEQ
jgi:hypothetical protein